MAEILTSSHPAWGDFCNRLDAALQLTPCNAQHFDHPVAVPILESYPDIDVMATVMYWHDHGGFCDCEILLNVVR